MLASAFMQKTGAESTCLRCRASGLCWRVGSSRSRRRLVRLVQRSYVQAAAETREGKRQERGLEIVLCAG